MTKFHTFSITTALVTALASSAFADGITYSNVELSYADIDSEDITVLSGELDYVRNKWSFIGGISFASTDGDDATLIDLGAGYAITPNLTGYVELSYIEDDIDDATFYGLGLEYQTSDYGVALQYDQLDGSDEDSLSLGGFVDLGATTLYAAVSDTDADTGYILGLNKEYTSIDLDIATIWVDDFDEGVTSASVDYDLGNKFSLLGSVLTLNDDFLSDGIVTAGVSYDISESFTAEANIGTAYGGTDGDGFTLELSYEIGKRRLRVLDQVTDYVEDTTPLFGTLPF